jgi:hypothetical protein
MKNIFLLIMLAPALLFAQVESPASGDSARDSVSTPQPDSVTVDSFNIGVTEGIIVDTAEPSVARPHLSAGSYLWSKDSVTLMEYHHVGEIATGHPAVQLYHLGNYGQPAWLGLGGSLPHQTTITVNGLSGDQILSSAPDPYRFSTEDAARFTLHPQYQSFWYGMPGDVLVMDIEKYEWNAPRPLTRLRHTESANEYLYTDGMFTLNPNEQSNIYLALTRTSIGSTSGNNAARFANNRHESWNARLAYRNTVSDIFTLSGRLQYDDHLTLLNGGVQGVFDPSAGATPYLYEAEDEGTFATEAFDAKAAVLINETMYSEGQHYYAEAAAMLQWDNDSMQVTRLRLTVDSDVRRFRDDVGRLYPGDSLALPKLNLTDHWSLYQAVLDHSTHLGWAELELQGAFGGYGAIMGGGSLDDNDIVAHARGKLGLFLGPVALAGFARLDQRFGSSTVSFGAGGELPVGPLTFWGGSSFAARPRSPIERLYSGDRVTVIGDRSADLDKFAVIEGGVRFSSDWLSLDLRGFARNETRYSSLSGLAYADTIIGRYSLIVEELPGGISRTFIGGSADARLSIWRLHIDQKAALVSVDVEPALQLTPELTYSAELYFRGSLIEGTLDLRVGGRFSYAGQFHPLLFHPETGVFVRNATTHPALRSYTDIQRIDLFLFATIKNSATIHLMLYNLLDDRHISTEFYPMFDRAFRLGVDWVFTD